MIHYTKREELLNSLSHGLGIGLAVAVGVWFIRAVFLRHGDGFMVWGLALYLFGMFSSYASSTIYHATRETSRWKERLRKCDHAAIYWHIAGSYSPLTLIALMDQGAWGWVLFCFVWTCAVVGTVFSFNNLKEHSNRETLCFCLMGLSVLVAFKPLMDAVTKETVMWIILEGVFFITGALFYSLNHRRYMHSVFHFFVLLGSMCHIIAVWKILG